MRYCVDIDGTICSQTFSINGIKDYGDVMCECKHYDGEIADFVAQGIKFDFVIAPDEFLTYANNETQQKQLLSIISKIQNKAFITTIKDYKNMYASQRYFEEPFTLRSNKGSAIVIRKREWDQVDKQAWIQENYIIHNDELMICEPRNRRTMYFKQLAKFTSDNGGKNFSIHKNLFYKPLLSKAFEHVISIDYE